MALIICESFDGVSAASHLSGKWTEVTGVAIATGRNGNGLNRGSGTSTIRIALAAAEQDDLLVIGAALQMSDLAGAEAFVTLRGDTNGTTHITVNVNVNGAIEIRRGTTGSGTVIATSPNNVIQASPSWHYVEVKVRLSDSTNDLFVSVDGVNQTLTPGGPYDTKNAGTATVFDNISFTDQGTGSNRMVIDDIYALNEKTTDALGNTSTLTDRLGDCRIEALSPNGNGNSSQLTGSDGNSTDNYLLVDEVTPDDDTTYVESAVDNDKDTYAFANLASTSGGVAAVQTVTRARKTLAGTRQLAHVTRLSGTEVDSTDFTLAETYGIQRFVFEKKPGGGAYARSDVNSAEFGVKIRP